MSSTVGYPFGKIVHSDMMIIIRYAQKKSLSRTSATIRHSIMILARASFSCKRAINDRSALLISLTSLSMATSWSGDLSGVVYLACTGLSALWLFADGGSHLLYVKMGDFIFMRCFSLDFRPLVSMQIVCCSTRRSLSLLNLGKSPRMNTHRASPSIKTWKGKKSFLSQVS